MPRPSHARRPPRRGDRPPSRPLALWQRTLLWVVWLGVLALLIAGTDTGSMSFSEFAALLAATGITVWTCRHPQGPIGTPIASPAELRGEFESRTNWPLVLLGVGLTLGGLAAGVKIVQDLSSGLTTVWGVLQDILLFILEWIQERLSNGTSGDVTHTKLYTLVILLPIGLLVLLFTLTPLLFRGTRFRVLNDENVELWQNGQWTLLNPEEFALVTADGSTIDWHHRAGEPPSFSFPQERVYSVERGIRASREVIGEYFRTQLRGAGFTLDPQDLSPTPARWRAERSI